MAITENGFFSHDPANGVHNYGDDGLGGVGAGSLTVDGGSIADLTATNLADQKHQTLIIGDGAGSDGTVTATGAGSKIHFDNDGQTDTRSELIIGQNGGTGTLDLTAGGTFEIRDTSGTAPDIDNDFDDEERIAIGQSAGSTGVLTADSGTFDVEGNAVLMGVGREGGTGTVSFDNGSTLILKSTGVGGEAYAKVQIGRGAGSTGTMSFSGASTGTVQGALEGYGYMHVGRDGGTGTLLVEEASTLTVQGGVNVNFNVGVGTDGGDPAVGSTGTATVTGAGSKITLRADDPLDDPDGTQIGVAIGRDGGTGTLNVLAGAVFEVVDDSTQAMLEPDYIGSEYMAVGRGQGSDGTVLVDGAGSTLAITGGAPGLDIGRDGGEGHVTFDNGATLTVESVTGNDLANAGNPDVWWQTSEAAVVVGRQNGGTGTLTFDHGSTGAVSGVAGGGLVVGRDTGAGTVNLLGGSTLTLSGLDFAFATVGRSGGTGLINVAGASHLEINGGSESADLLIGHFEGNETRYGPGFGRVVVTGNSSIDLTSASGRARVLVGNSATGELTLDDSQLILDGDSSNLEVGVEGGTGYLAAANGSLVELTGVAGATLSVGRGGGGSDEVAISRMDVDSSSVSIQGTNDASATIGSEGGFGMLDVRAGLFGVTSDGWTTFWAGSGGGALVEIGGGSTLSLESTDAIEGGLDAVIGANDGEGIMTLRGSSTWNITSATGAGLHIGGTWAADGTDSGDGTLNVLGGSRINFEVDADFGANLRVGGGDGSIANVVVSGGSVIDLDTVGGADSWGGLQIGTHGADSATVLVDGIGSRIDHVDYAQIGFDPTDGGSSAGGSGVLTIKNGGVVNAETILVGAGGTLGGYRGTVNGSAVFLHTGGKIDLRDGLFGNFTINGDIITTNAGNGLSIDVGSNNRQDTLTFNSFDNSGGQLAINLNVLGGYQFAAGETRAIIDLNGNLPTFSVTGQNANFGFYGGHLASDPDDSVYFKALNAGNSALTSLATLDFGVGGPLATVIYNAATNNGTVKGGIYGAIGGSAYNIDRFALTDLADTVTITGTTARAFSYDGRGGNDTINGGAGIDNMVGGTGADILKGNAGNDILNGGLGIYSDQLFGGLGNDSLTGGSGNDFFVFNTALNASTNRDNVVDFANVANNNDTFRLENAIFTKLAAVGGLNPAFFKAAAVATDANDYIVYNRTTGALFYDINGNGAGGAIQFATLLNKPVLTASDFAVI